MKIISKTAEYTFDDVLLLPGYSDYPISDEFNSTNLKCKVSKNIELKIPITSSPMPGVTESQMAIAIGKMGGIGFIHHFQSLERQIAQIKEVKKEKTLVAACVSDTNEDVIKRVDKLVKAGADLISLETAHAHNKQTLSIIRKIKKSFPKVDLSVSLVVTPEATLDVIKAGADSVRVGIGGGSHCTTRLVTGAGRPQLSAIMACSKIAKKYNIPILADTGIKYPGDITKAIAFGADCVMIGGLFTGTDQAPGKIINKAGKRYKMTWGMCTDTAMRQKQFFTEAFKHPRSAIKQLLKNLIKPMVLENKLFEEGVENLVPYKGDVKNIIQNLINGLTRSMWYIGVHDLKEIAKKSKVVHISSSTTLENIPRI